ncbi:MAG: DUF4398 domain-containing protein [Persicimonas sp.]
MQRLLTVPALALGLLILPLVGCATADRQDLSAREYSQPRETIQAAQSMGADEVPRARMFLSYASEQMREADQAIEAGENAQAKRLLVRAQADAELALALAQERELRQQVRQIDNRIQRLRQEVE